MNSSKKNYGIHKQNNDVLVEHKRNCFKYQNTFWWGLAK